MQEPVNYYRRIDRGFRDGCTVKLHKTYRKPGLVSPATDCRLGINGDYRLAEQNYLTD